MNRQEARAYFDWFVAQIPHRRAVLERAVQTSEEPSLRSWAADLTPKSLGPLGEWFALQVHTERVSDAYKHEFELEREKIEPKYRQIFQEPAWLLTTETISIVHDVGMYLGEAFRTEIPSLHWKLWTRGKRDTDYQEPVLSAHGLYYGIQPVRLVHVIALKVAERRADPDPLTSVFGVWVKKVTSDWQD